MKDLNNRILSSLLGIVACFTLAFWLLFYTDISLYKALYIKNTGLIAIVLLIGFFIITKQLIIKARTEQQLQDIIQFNKIHEIEKLQLITELKKYEGLEQVVYDLEEKLESSKLYEIPLISNLLLQKKILLHQQGVQLEIETYGNLEALNKIDIGDFNFILSNSIKKLREIRENDYIGLKIYERETSIELTLFSSASNIKPNINAEELKWNLLKTAKKYQAIVDVDYEPIGNFPIITVNFPKQIKTKKVS